MGFGWLCTFRNGQWRAYRSFALNERRDIGRRAAVIEAELARIGYVRVIYGRDDAGVVTEERVGISVPKGSSLERLLQAYIAQGGNPFDVSLFLSPDDATILQDPTDLETELPVQPYGGVVYPKSGEYAPGVQYEGGFLVIKKYVPARTGGRKELLDTSVSAAVDLSRRWLHQTIDSRLHELEARILKLVDLREQLLQELDDLTMAAAGTVGSVPSLDQDFYSEDLGVAKIVAAIDRIFYQTDAEGVPNFDALNAPDQSPLRDYPSLYLDVEDGQEDNTAL